MRLVPRLTLMVLPILLVHTPRRAVAQDSTRFNVVAKTPLRAAPSAGAAKSNDLTPGTVVLVIGPPDVQDEFVRVTVPSVAEGWVDGGDLSLDTADSTFRAELSKLHISPIATQGPQIIGFDTVLVRHPGGAQAVEQVILPSYSIVTIKLEPFGIARPIPPPAMKNFLDGTNWMLMEPLRYVIDPAGNAIEVPKGFVTDFASVPPRLRSLLSSTGPHGMPAVVHDFLYWSQACTKDQADHLFRLAMMDSEVSPRLREQLYTAVHVFGGRAWRSNHTERTAGLVRVVPPPDDDVPANKRWTAYRNDLKTRHVVEQAYTQPTAAACALGS